jgi:hypothetical protein
MMLHECPIRVWVQGGATFEFAPGTAAWGEVIGLLQGYFSDEEIARKDQYVVPFKEQDGIRI